MSNLLIGSMYLACLISGQTLRQQQLEMDGAAGEKPIVLMGQQAQQPLVPMPTGSTGFALTPKLSPAPGNPSSDGKTSAGPAKDGKGASSTSAAGEKSSTDAKPDKLETLTKDLSELKTKVEGITKTKYPNVQINGVFQADAGFFSQDQDSLHAYGALQAGADFRRARLSAKGSVAEHTNYFMQMDFGFFGRPTFTDVWVEQTGVPILGNVRVGQWKQPFSLEVVSSFRYTTFMERSTLFQAFTPFRHIGIGFYDHAETLDATWAASFFRTGQDQFGNSVSNDGGWGSAERLTYLPVWDEACKGKYYLHLGLGHFFNSPPRDTVNFRSVPELFIGESNLSAANSISQSVPTTVNGTPFFVQTGNLTNIANYHVFGTELLWVNGPLSVQSEAMVNLINQGGNDNSAVLPGAYVQVGYFLTGEHRPYDRKAGAIDRVIPCHDFIHQSGCATGYGAWEIAGRFSYLDLNDAQIHGGTISNYTLGVNWYWNPYTKVVFNYVHSITDLAGVAAYSPSPISGLTPAGDTNTDMFAVRMQVDF